MNPAARALIAASLALAAFDAGALALGEPQVRSALGEALDVRIPVTLGSGESIGPTCFKLAAGPGDGPRVTAGSVSLERSASGTWLRLRGTASVTEPALALSIAANCTGQSGEYRRDYTLAIGTGAAAGPATDQAAGTPAPAAPGEPLFPSIATLIARIGDTLASIAEAIFPNNHGAQRTYIAALRDSNPPLARLADDEPIPVDTPVALPDLRSFARGRHLEQPETQVAAAPAPARAARKAPEAKAPVPSLAEAPAAPAPTRLAAPRPAAPKAARPAPAEPPRLAKPTAAAAPRAPRSGDGFMLRLSAPEMDLARSRGIDDRSRQELRERLMILDADDQVAALLSLKHSVKQLESQVAALQLKLSGMPSSFPAPKPAPEGVPPPAPPKAQPAPPPPVVTKAEPPPSPPPVAKTEPAPVAKTEPAPAPAAKTEPPPAPAAAKPAPAPKPAMPVTPPSNEWLDYALWALAVLLAVAAIVLAVRLARRRRESAGYEPDEPATQAAGPGAAPAAAAPTDDQIVVADEIVAQPGIAAEPASMPSPARREIDSDVELATRLPSNTDDLRRRYIEERFPEIGKGAISIDDPDSVVKGARLFYEDGEIARAVELLQYAVERKPAEIKAWLALFEIFRLERLAGEFAELATRFREQHGKTEYWRKVQYFGREIDPGNALYQEAPIDHFETISPTRAKRIAQEASFDPIAENWLGAPMDFENEVLANELRKTLMADAGIGEQDLVPNPMPALRSIEMFTVA